MQRRVLRSDDGVSMLLLVLLYDGEIASLWYCYDSSL